MGTQWKNPKSFLKPRTKIFIQKVSGTQRWEPYFKTVLVNPEDCHLNTITSWPCSARKSPNTHIWITMPPVSCLLCKANWGDQSGSWSSDRTGLFYLKKTQNKNQKTQNYKFRQYSKTCLLLASPCSHRSPWWTINSQFWTVTGTFTLLKFNSMKETWRSVYSFSATNILPPAERLLSSLASQSRVTVYTACQMQPMNLLRKLDPLCTNIN